MFPITDPSRMLDIRMRRRRAFWLLVSLVAVPLLLWHDGHPRHPGATGADIDPTTRSLRSDGLAAAEIASVLHRIPLVGRLDWTVEGAKLPEGRRDASALSATGSSLQITLACTHSITLVPQQDLSDRVFVSTMTGPSAFRAGLRLVGEGPALQLAESCGHEPADVVVQAPPSMPLTLRRFGDTPVRLGSFTGPVHLVLAGSADTAVDAAGPAVIEKTGSGDVTIGSLNGDAQLSQRGSGDISIRRLRANHVGILASGSGNVMIAAGHVGHLDASLSGSVDLSGQVEIDEASVQASEDCDVSLPHVSNLLDHEASDR